MGKEVHEYIVLYTFRQVRAPSPLGALATDTPAPIVYRTIQSVLNPNRINQLVSCLKGKC
jgi:hypothetical protein